MFLSLVAGVGKTARVFAHTRHNLGWIVVEALAQQHGLAWKHASQFEAEIARWDIGPGRTRWLMKPLTFMNNCGRSVGALARYHKLEPEALAVVYDDLTIDL